MPRNLIVFVEPRGGLRKEILRFFDVADSMMGHRQEEPVPGTTAPVAQLHRLVELVDGLLVACSAVKRGAKVVMPICMPGETGKSTLRESHDLFRVTHATRGERAAPGE